jgi:hypothetical protein
MNGDDPMATFAKPLIGLIGGFWKAKPLRSRRIPALSTLHLNDHDLADLNLPTCVRAQFEAERAREAGDRLGRCR